MIGYFELLLLSILRSLRFIIALTPEIIKKTDIFTFSFALQNLTDFKLSFWPIDFIFYILISTIISKRFDSRKPQ